MSLAGEVRALYTCKEYSLWTERVEQGDYVARALSTNEIESNYPSGSVSSWKLERDLSAYPQLSSQLPLVDALYSLSLEELEKNITADGLFDTGAEWKGVWTRDVSYSIVLALAALHPTLAKASLLSKVRRDRIVQDSGTGGSWPVSSDRMTWALAAWEIYLVSGDELWLRDSYRIIRNSMLDDQHAVIEPASGLARGETSFLDWREQTYPRWMGPPDIYESMALGTNAVFCQTYRILGWMAQQLGEPAEDWQERSDKIRHGLNERFWMTERGAYGEYLYGRAYPALSPRFEALGSALCVLFDVADPAQRDGLMQSAPLMDFGVPTVSPQAAGIAPYHNRSVWPFVQAFWNLAAARSNRDEVLLHGLASIYRAGALFLTNKENFVADSGDSQGTEVNSDRQLWSVAGHLAMTYRVLFGMSFEVDGLHLRPVIPESFGGTMTLTNFVYRQAVLSIEVRGFGSKIRTIRIDGEDRATAIVPVDLLGAHTVVLEMIDQVRMANGLLLREEVVAPDAPVLRLSAATLSWESVPGAARFKVYRNGRFFVDVEALEIALPPGPRATEYQVSAVDGAGVESYLSAPVLVGAQGFSIPADPGERSVMLDGRDLELMAELSTGGSCLLRFHYANGSGPVNTDNKCALRTLLIDDVEVGVVVFPQRGQDDWNDYGLSSSLRVSLEPGRRCFELRLMERDTNMNVEVNRMSIASLEGIFLDEPR